jgi:hypothetical protein
MTRILYTHTETNSAGEPVTVTVVRTDDYETREVALDNSPGLVLPETAFRVDLFVNSQEMVDHAYLRQLDAFTQAVQLFEENGIILN